MKSKEDIFAEAHSDLKDVAARIACWQQFLTDERRRHFEALGAELIGPWQYDRFETMHIACDDHPTVVAATIFERDNLFTQYGKTNELRLTAFMDIPNVDNMETVPRLTIGVNKLKWTVSLSWFTLKHRIRQGERRGDLWFFPPEHSRLREPKRVKEHDFLVDTKREEMFEFLLADVEKNAVNVTFAKTLRERTAVLRATQPLREDEVEWTLKG